LNAQEMAATPVPRGLGLDQVLCAGRLSDDPTVVGGPANFLRASTMGNDDMTVIRGDTPTTDIDLGEFPPLDSQHAFAEFVDHKGPPALGHLRTGDWWKVCFGGATRPRRCVYFSGAPA
jgi:hypothetical protein